MTSAAGTRFHNDRVRAAQRSMGNNLSAVNSLKLMHSPKRNRPAGPSINNNVGQVLDTSSVPREQSVSRPTGPPLGFKPMYASAPQQQAPAEVSPEVKGLLDGIHIDNLINSPDVEAAYTKVRLRDYFHGRDSGPDVGRQVLEIVNSNGPK